MGSGASRPSDSGVYYSNSHNSDQHHHHQEVNKKMKKNNCSGFQMPLHYPRFKKSDYENMPEWQLDCLLKEYGLPVVGAVKQKRRFAMGAFLWPSENE